MPYGSDPFEALADATRRKILESLHRNGDQTAGALAASFPEISRPAVSRHLRILREAKLVVACKTGKEWHYALDERGLVEVYRGWLAQFEPVWDRALMRLKRLVETDPAGKSPPRRRQRP